MNYIHGDSPAICARIHAELVGPFSHLRQNIRFQGRACGEINQWPERRHIEEVVSGPRPSQSCLEQARSRQR